MAAETNPIDFSLVEEREAEMVAFNGGSQQPIKRKGLFLNPTSSNSPSPRPIAAAVSIVRDEPKYHPHFRWWADPHWQWDQWVEKLEPKYHTLWKKAGIFIAIMASRLKLRRDPSSLLGVARFWCEETNTFLFPWAEATVTLEDVMILGGFSLLGEPVRVREPLGGVIGHMVSKMITELNNFKSKCPKAEQSAWMKHYVKAGERDDIEHIAFLSLWLSRFVLIADNGKSISECVFQVAVRLARGTRIALAPAVLASIYRELRVVKNHVCSDSSSPLAVWAPFNILQMWMWERFPSLSPNLKSLTNSDMPRAARWNMTGHTLDLSSVMQVLALELPDGFEWRPYALELKIGRKLALYMNEGGWVCSDVTKDDELQSFARCLRACELVGLDCIEQYQPHRVAMQFGFDQDIPNFLPRANNTWEDTWKTYDISSKTVKFYMPHRFFKSAVTLQYSNWWRNIRKEVKGFTETEVLTRPALKPHEISSKSICSRSQEQQAFAIKSLRTELDSHLESSETMNQNLDVTRKIEVASEKQQNEELGLDSFNEEEITEVVKKTNAREFHHDLKATEKSKEANEKQLEGAPPEPWYVNEERILKYPMKTNVGQLDLEWKVAEKPEAKRKREEIEERDPARRKELERDLKINRLKEEITSIQAQIRYWESLADKHSKSELISSRI